MTKIQQNNKKSVANKKSPISPGITKITKKLTKSTKIKDSTKNHHNVQKSQKSPKITKIYKKNPNVAKK